jgi:hypothetical protein
MPGAKRINLAAGRYVVQSGHDANWFFVIGNATDLTLSGQGDSTQIIFRDPTRGGFLVAGGIGVAIENLAVDYDPPPMTQGTILAVHDGSFQMQLDAGFPSLAEPWFTIDRPAPNMAMVFDPRTRRLKAHAPDYLFVASWRESEPGVWTLQLADDERHKTAMLSPGDRFVVMARRGNGTFRFQNMQYGALRNVTIHASPSLAVALIGCDAMAVQTMRIEIAPGSDRLIASNGDGIHCQNNRTGPRVEDCLFEGLGDDAINIYATPMFVREVIDASRVVIDGVMPRVGDRVQTLEPQRGIVRGRPQVIAVDAQMITFASPVDGMAVGDTLYNLSACGAGFVIRNNHMRNHRRNGALLRGGDGVVEGNTFEHVGGFGVCAGNEPGWPEGPAPWGLVVRNNTFIGGGEPQGYGHGAAIVIHGAGIGRAAEGMIIHDLHISNNRFTDPPGQTAISITSAHRIVIENNRAGDDPARVHTFNTDDVRIDALSP